MHYIQTLSCLTITSLDKFVYSTLNFTIQKLSISFFLEIMNRWINLNRHINNNSFDLLHIHVEEGRFEEERFDQTTNLAQRYLRAVRLQCQATNSRPSSAAYCIVMNPLLRMVASKQYFIKLRNTKRYYVLYFMMALSTCEMKSLSVKIFVHFHDIARFGWNINSNWVRG